MWQWTGVVLAGLVLASCTGGIRDDGPPSGGGRIATEDATPRAEPPSRYGNPGSYVVRGKRYYTLRSGRGFSERGVASWYGRKFHGRRTSSGEPYDMYAMTAAHKALPLPSYVRVTHLETGRSVVVRVNDRGPFHPNRIIDLSYAAAARLGIVGRGTGPVELTVVGPDAQPSDATARAGAVNMYLQVGAYEQVENARRMARRLRQIESAAVDVKPVRSEGRTVYRVRLGPMSRVEDADALSARLVADGLEPPLLVVESTGLGR